MSTATAPASVRNELEKERFSPIPPAEEFSLPKSLAPPDREVVSCLAYEYWVERQQNNIPGSAEDDWYRAEKDLGI